MRGVPRGVSPFALVRGKDLMRPGAAAPLFMKGEVNLASIAVIDIGTNSTRLLVAEASAAGRIIPLHTFLKTTRLGEGIEGGVLLGGPVARTVEALLEMKAEARARSSFSIVAVATSAVRDADNREWFLEEVFRKTGIKVRVLAGTEEAFYSYLGVAGEFGEDLESTVIVDIGGGSTEFTWKSDAGVMCRSVNAGAVRMTEGGHDDPMIKKIMREALGEVSRGSPGRLTGVGGTVTTLAAMDMGLTRYDRSLVHGYTLTGIRVEKLLERLVRAGPEGRKSIPGLQPARADIIEAGVRILLIIMRFLEIDTLTVSEADLMYGLAMEEAKTVETKNANVNQK